MKSNTEIIAKLRQLADAIEANPDHFTGELDIDIRVDVKAIPTSPTVRHLKHHHVGEIWQMTIATSEKLS